MRWVVCRCHYCNLIDECDTSHDTYPKDICDDCFKRLEREKHEEEHKYDTSDDEFNDGEQS